MKTKRLLALLLAMAMMFTMLPTAAFADIYVPDVPEKPETQRYTVEFYAGNGMTGTPYETQTVKAGDSLVRPETPEILDGYNEFDGWYIGGSQSNGVWTGGTEVQFGPVTEEWLKANATNGVIQVHARFLNAVHVTFYDCLPKTKTDGDGNYVEPTVVTTRSMTGGPIDLNSVTAESGELGKVFDKWVDANGNAVSTSYTATEDTNLYATFVAGYSLVFNANGDGASNTATQYLKGTEVTRAPTTPARPGYTFQGWYTEATGGTQFTFGSALTADTTVYAHWTAATAKYTVIYWYENADDDGYSYAGATTGTIATGSTITSSSFQNTNFIGRDSTHFTYNSAKAESQVVAGDGSTVLNVYFTRNTYILRFVNGDNNNTVYQVITAKYQATIGDKWPIAGQQYGSYTRVPSNLYQWHYTPVGTTQDQAQATKIFTMTDGLCKSGGMIITSTTRDNMVEYTINYMMESLDEDGTSYDGTYYEKSTLYSQTANYGSGLKTWGYKEIDGFTRAYDTSATISNNTANLYYKRNRNTITFYDNHSTTVASISDVMFEMPLKDVQYNNTAISAIIPACPSELNSQYYTFGGWYTTPECYDGTEAKFTGTMPNAPLSFYAKWIPATFNVTYNANGGAFTDADGNENEELKLTVNYGEKLTNVPTPYNEGYLFLGWVDEDGNAWNFDTTITEAVTLYAKWHTDHVLNIVYNVGDGVTQVSDPNQYDDGATAIVRPYGTSGARFVGWSLGLFGGDGDYNAIYQPGDEIEVSSATDVADGTSDYTVTLYAVFAEPLTTSITFDANGGKFSETDEDGNTTTTFPTKTIKLDNNEGVDLDTINPTRSGYVLRGWSKEPDATAATYTADGTSKEEIALAVKTPGETHTLYAVWTEAFYVYHSSDNTIEAFPVPNDGETFDITKRVKDGYLYGGYYLSYGGASSSFDPDSGKDEGGTPYTLDTIPTEDITFWKDPVSTTSGKKIEPTKDAVPEEYTIYYLKEVPSSYLRPRIYYTYSGYYGNKLTALYPVTAVDDLNYNCVGFDLVETNTDSTSSKEGTTVYTTVTFTEANNVVVETFSVYGTFKDDGIKKDTNGNGYLFYTPMYTSGDPSKWSPVSISPYWMTPDGIKVYGTHSRTYDPGNGYYNITGGLHLSEQTPAESALQDVSSDFVPSVYALAAFSVASIAWEPEAIDESELPSIDDGSEDEIDSDTTIDPDDSEDEEVDSDVTTDPNDSEDKDKAEPDVTVEPNAPDGEDETVPDKKFDIDISFGTDDEEDLDLPVDPDGEDDIEPPVDPPAPDEGESPDESETGEIVIRKIDGKDISLQTVEAGDLTGEISYKEKPGYYFVGWFTDSRYTEPADFSNVQESMTVYARYISARSLKLNVTLKERGKRVTVDASFSLDGQDVDEASFEYECSSDFGTEFANPSGKPGSYSSNWALNAFSSNDTITVTPHWVTLDGTAVSGASGTYRSRPNSALWGF